jgi:coenzyme F420-reducing hydrogenase delta subunit
MRRKNSATKAGPVPRRAPKPVVTAFVCRACAGSEQRKTIRDVLGRLTRLTVVDLVCSGQMRTGFFLAALEGGADGVCLFACPIDQCRYREGSQASLARFQKTKALLDSVGVHPERVARFSSTPRHARTWAAELTAFAETLVSLGKREALK